MVCDVCFQKSGMFANQCIMHHLFSPSVGKKWSRPDFSHSTELPHQSRGRRTAPKSRNRAGRVWSDAHALDLTSQRGSFGGGGRVVDPQSNVQIRFLSVTPPRGYRTFFFVRPLKMLFSGTPIFGSPGPLPLGGGVPRPWLSGCRPDPWG